jgi:amino acid permease
MTDIVTDSPLLPGYTPEEPPADAPKEGGGVTTVIGAVNALFGQSVLGIPHAVAFCGLIPGVILMCATSMLNLLSSVIVIKLADTYAVDSFDVVGAKILGKVGSMAISCVSITLFTIILAGYLVIAIRSIASWFEDGGIKLPETIPVRLVEMLGYAIVPIILSIPKTMVVMTFAGVVNVSLTIFYLVTLIIKTVMLVLQNQYKPQITLMTMNIGFFSEISLLAGATGLPVMVLSKLKNYSKQVHKRSFVSFMSIFIAFLATLMSGILGYMMFGDGVEGVVLDSFDSSDLLMEAVRTSFFVVATCAYPGVALALMDYWSSLLFKKTADKIDCKQKSLVLFCTNLIPLVVAVFLQKAGPAIAVGGAFGGCILNYCFPALMWVWDPKRERQWWETIGCWVLIIFAAATAVVTTYLAVGDAIRELQ